MDIASNGYPKLIPIDEEPDDEIVHTLRLGKTDRATHQPLDPRPYIDVLAFDFLRLGFAHLVLLSVHMTLIGTPAIRVEPRDAKRR